MIVLPVLAVAPFNPVLAFLLAVGAFIYVVIYTIWLKPRTNLNIVIGRLAGSAAVLSGGAAVGAWRDPAVIALAVMLFSARPSTTMAMASLPGTGLIYAVQVGMASAVLPWQVAWLVADPVKRRAWHLFHTSNLYLAVVLVATIVAGIV